MTGSFLLCHVLYSSRTAICHVLYSSPNAIQIVLLNFMKVISVMDLGLVVSKIMPRVDLELDGVDTTINWHQTLHRHVYICIDKLLGDIFGGLGFNKQLTATPVDFHIYCQVAFV